MRIVDKTRRREMHSLHQCVTISVLDKECLEYDHLRSSLPVAVTPI